MTNCENWELYYDYEYECIQDQKTKKKTKIASAILIPIFLILIGICLFKFRFKLRGLFRNFRSNPREFLYDQCNGFKERIHEIACCEYIRRRIERFRYGDQPTLPLRRYQATRLIHRIPSEEDLSMRARNEASRLLRSAMARPLWGMTDDTTDESYLNDSSFRPTHTSSPIVREAGVRVPLGRLK